MVVALGACDDSSPASSPPAPTVVRSADLRADAADERCRAPCAMLGQCAYDEASGRCLARREEDCQRSDACKTSGLCHHSKGACVGLSADDCEASSRCEEAGLCAYTGLPARPCRAGTDAHCQASTACRRHGRCSERGGSCVLATDADCARSERCLREGACHRVAEGQSPTCRATSDADCAKSTACTKEQRCRAVEGFCRPGGPAETP